MPPGRRYFEDIEVGEEQISPGRTITETDVVLFAGVSGDYNVLHTDAELMKTSQFGERIAHGLLVLAVQGGLFARTTASWATRGLAELGWRFRGPVRLGDTVRLRWRVTGKREGLDPRAGVLVVERTVVNQRDETVQSGETDVLVERRP